MKINFVWAKDDHLAFFVNLAQKTEHNLCVPNQHPWTKKLDPEIDNLQDALFWAYDKAAEGDGAALKQAIRLAAWRLPRCTG